MRRLGERHPAVVAAAYEAGVPIYVGTDAGGTLPHGLAVDEMLRLHERAGMSTVDVLATLKQMSERKVHVIGGHQTAEKFAETRDPQHILSHLTTSCG